MFFSLQKEEKTKQTKKTINQPNKTTTKNRRVTKKKVAGQKSLLSVTDKAKSVTTDYCYFFIFLSLGVFIIGVQGRPGCNSRAGSRIGEFCKQKSSGEERSLSMLWEREEKQSVRDKEWV